MREFIFARDFLSVAGWSIAWLILVGAYNIDSHNTQRHVANDDFVRNEGGVRIPTKPYPISYRSICPPRNQCANLLVPVGLSANHIAVGSIRMEPVFMVLGQSSAIAASIGVRSERSVQDIPYDSLKPHLMEAGQVFDFQWCPARIGLHYR